MTRHAEHPILPMFLERHSPRAMSGAPLEASTLRSLLEAARWAPSAANSQPWRFAYGLAHTASFDRLLALLAPGNQVWCQRAGALLVGFAKVVNDKGERVPTAPLDLGAAWMSLALQGQSMGLVIHGMAGFDHARAAEALGATSELEPLLMIAIGHPGEVEDLPEPLRPREAPNGRHPQAEWAFEGTLPAEPSAR